RDLPHGPPCRPPAPGRGGGRSRPSRRCRGRTIRDPGVSMSNALITGWGAATPPTVLSNHDLESLTETNDEWITTRTGIKERRVSHVPTSVLAAVAGQRALAAAGKAPEDVDLCIVATCTPDTIL